MPGSSTEKGQLHTCVICPQSKPAEVSPITSFHRDKIDRSYHDSNHSLQVKMVLFSVPWNSLLAGNNWTYWPRGLVARGTAPTTYNVLILSVRGSGHHTTLLHKDTVKNPAGDCYSQKYKCQGWQKNLLRASGAEQASRSKMGHGVGRKRRETSVSNTNSTCNPHDQRSCCRSWISGEQMSDPHPSRIETVRSRAFLLCPLQNWLCVLHS